MRAHTDGSTTSRSWLQPLKAYDGMIVSWHLLKSVRCMDVHPEKAPVSIPRRASGNTSSSNPVQPINAPSPIYLHVGLNAIYLRLSHRKKHAAGIISTWVGRVTTPSKLAHS